MLFGGENLKRWTKDAGLDPTGITIKISRKTWESGLYRYIPSKNKLIIGRFMHHSKNFIILIEFQFIIFQF